MIFCVDIGNSNTVIGVFENEDIRFRWRIATVATDTADDLYSRLYPHFVMEKLDKKMIDFCVISSVVPMWNHSWERFMKSYFGINSLFVGPGIKTGIKIAVDNPKEVGADRIVNSVAAITLFPEGSVVVDSGTAITVDIVTPEKAYVGGTIMPGIMISLDALASKTAKLGRVQLEKPENVYGKNTVESIRSGIYYGFAGMIDRVVEEILKEISFKPKIIATGGLARELSEASKYIEHYEKDLTLKGLYMIGVRNNSGEK